MRRRGRKMNYRAALIIACAALLGGAAGAAAHSAVDYPGHAWLFLGHDHVDNIQGIDVGDDLYGYHDNDTLREQDGSGYANGQAGADGVFGGQHNDGLVAEIGRDYMEGGDGDDNLWPGGDEDIVDAGAGQDDISADDGNRDEIDGGSGTGDNCNVDGKDVHVRCNAY